MLVDTKIKFTEKEAAFLQTSTSDLNVSTRTKSCLLNDNIMTVFTLLQFEDRDLLRIPSFGRKSLNELKEILAVNGFHTGKLKPYAGQLDAVDISDLKTLEEAGFLDVGQSVISQDPVMPATPLAPISSSSSDVLSDWINDVLPESLRNGLSPQFLSSVLNSPEVKSKVRQTVVTAITSGLNLNDIK